MEFTRQSLVRRAVAAELFVVATNSDGNTARRGELLALLGPDAAEEVLDPGIEIVKRRLSVNGRLSEPVRTSNIALVWAAVLNGVRTDIHAWRCPGHGGAVAHSRQTEVANGHSANGSPGRR